LKKLLVPALVLAGAVIIVLVISQLLPEKEASVIPEKKMLAVLPFENSGNPEDEYFADGITDEIIARMTNVADLSVIARNSSIKYKKTKKSIKEIGAELGVNYILSGTIRWQKSAEESGRVRVTPTLIRVADSIQIWANVYDESITEVFRVQSDISKKVVASLGVALNEPEQNALEASPTQNMEAYDYYLRGKDNYYLGGEGETEWASRIAIEDYKKAIVLDQNYFQAYAHLSYAHSMYYWMYFDHSPERAIKAKEAAERAYQINSEAPDVYMALGYYFYHCEMDYNEALKHFTVALSKQPNNARILAGMAYVKRRQGKVEEALANLKMAVVLDPRSSGIAYNLGLTYFLFRNFQEAENWYDHALILSPEFQRVYFQKIRLHIFQGGIKKARQILEEASGALGSLDPHLIIYYWVLVDIFEGKYDDAIKRLSSVSGNAFSDQAYFVPKDNLLGQIYSLMNNNNVARRHYEFAVSFLEEKIKEDPEDSRYHSALGIAYSGLGREVDAVSSALKATEILPISEDALRGAMRAAELAQVLSI